jgi:phosphatidylglycerophosphate synthase
LISSKLGRILDRPLAPLAQRIPLGPNAITVFGFLVTAVAAFCIPFNLVAAGLLILLGGLFDMLDGLTARAKGMVSAFGAFLDSTLDRYSDSLIFLAFAWYFLERNDFYGIFWTLGALVGALLTSYVRARAEGISIECSVGLMERPERVVLLALACITSRPLPFMIVLCVFSHITVIQRILHVYRAGRQR